MKIAITVRVELVEAPAALVTLRQAQGERENMAL
jgi:hypothetical protein